MADPILDALDIIDAESRRIRTIVGAPVPPAPAYYSARTDRALLKKPAITLWGAAGSIQTDPTFGSRILRVTDPNLAGGRSWRVPSNAHAAAWNASSTAFFAMNSGGGVKVFNLIGAPSFAVSSSVKFEPYSQTEPMFSRIDPDVLYTIGGPQTRTIRAWSLSKQTFTDVVDLDTIVPPPSGVRTYIGGLQVGGDPETLCILCGGAGQDDHYLALLYTPATKQTVIFNARLRFNCNLHAAVNDRSNRYVLLYPRQADIAAAGQVIVIDRQTDISTKAPNAGGHDALGFGRWINAAESATQPYDGAQWQRRTLFNVHAFEDLIPNELRPMVKLSDHPTWNNCTPANSEPFLTCLYRNVPDPADPVVEWRAWDEELLAVATDGSGTVWRFAHHRSLALDEVNPKQLNFWSQPIANVSPDGSYAIFTSNQEHTLGKEPSDPQRFRQDVFLVKLR